MKNFILITVLLFVTAFQVSAQKPNCGDSNPRPIIGEQRPCEGEVKEYKVLLFETKIQLTPAQMEQLLQPNAPGWKPEWDVPRASAGEGPVGWQIVKKGTTLPVTNADILPYDNNNTRKGYILEEVTGSGPNTVYQYYSAVTVLVGRKPGTMKLTIKDPECGTKVATLPVMPGISFTIVVTGPTDPCIGEENIYTSTINIHQQGPKPSSFSYKWHYPDGWEVVGDDNKKQITLIPNANPGYVWVEIIDINNKTNNGNGLGPRGYCNSASNMVHVNPIFCDPCPPSEVSDDENNYTVSYLGSTMNWATPDSWPTTTVSFKIESFNGILLDKIFIDLIPDFPAPPVPLVVTPTADDPNYTASFDGVGVISYINTTDPVNELTVSFTFPTGYFIDLYGISIFKVGELEGVRSASTTYTGIIEDVRVCMFDPLIPLAVELSSFQGKATASGIELTWTTASEENNDRFEVQRSSDGKEFKTVGTVKGAGNSSTLLRYSYLDKPSAKGTYYYRLNSIEFNGTSEFSKVIAVENNAVEATAGITLYPNPATGQDLNIVLDAANSNNKMFKVVITDINGRKVFEQQLTASDNSELKLTLPKLKMSKGMYMIKVQGDNLNETRKLLIE